MIQQLSVVNRASQPQGSTKAGISGSVASGQSGSILQSSTGPVHSSLLLHAAESSSVAGYVTVVIFVQMLSSGSGSLGLQVVHGVKTSSQTQTGSRCWNGLPAISVNSALIIQPSPVFSQLP